MSKNTSNPKKKSVTQQPGRRTLNTVTPTVERAIKPAPNKAKPPRPAKKQDVEDIERADSEGMAQPQDLPPTRKKQRRRTR